MLLNDADLVSVGLKHHQAHRLAEAERCYRAALASNPGHPTALHLLGVIAQQAGRFEEALTLYDRALAQQPTFYEALNNRALVLQQFRRFGEALATYNRLLTLRQSAEVFYNRGNVLCDLHRAPEALASYDRALALRPNYPEALHNRGNALLLLGRFEAALADYEALLILKPGHVHVRDTIANCAAHLCDWQRRIEPKAIHSPFVLLGYSDDLALQRQCAENFLEQKIPVRPPPLWAGQKWRHDKLRVAYISPDFRAHPIAFLTAELFEEHDRSRFEIVGISLGPDDKSDMRRRLMAGVDEFVDVRTMTDRTVATLMRDRQFDIAIDLAGYTAGSRPGIFAHRPSPIQANYLGFPGTMGAEFIDYIIADKTVAPFEQQMFYSEKIVHLPDCYQVNDTKRNIAGRAPTRREAGLPERGFVFCCFNSSSKITAEIFDIWTSLLHQVEGSVLWLLGTNEGAQRNLCKEAQRRGIGPSRLVFAGRLPLGEHLARHRLADLFLDTLPYSAHTTASDALWVGLPVLTCKGKAFAGRVAASLLHAVGVPELSTSSLEDYQRLALTLARDPALLAALRAKLAVHRDTYPLFNTVRFARHIEAAYTTMWETWQRGEPPKNFSVKSIA